VGWGTNDSRSAIVARGDDEPSIAWIGRPAKHGGVEVTRLAWFVEAAAMLPQGVRVTLVGERLERAAATLRRAGVECRVAGLDKHPPLHASDWIGRFDAVVICGAADSGPWPLFDALHAGVPVVAAPVGWATRLLNDGACGRLADGPAAIADAIRQVLSGPDRWREQRSLIRARVAEFSLATWVERNLALAAELSRQEAVPGVA
jgi:glycosyltransferase involved in cell wall biosynthesis